MPYRVTNVDGLLEVMRSLQGERTQAEYAMEIGVSTQYLSDVFSNKSEPGPKLLQSLGITRNTTYTVPEQLMNIAATAASVQPQKAARHASSKKAQRRKK